jgi:DeoR/GlpR family transcriptional regulator of sugar metabolism
MNARQEALLAILAERGAADVATLADVLRASEATIRRDLCLLERDGLLIRTYGGARLMPQASLVMRTFAEKRDRLFEEKVAVAGAAAQFVKPGAVVALDSGTTAWQVAVALTGVKPLTVLACSLPVIEQLGEAEGVTIHCAGGQFRLANLDFVGPATVQAFADLRADVAFISGDSMLPARGLFAADEPSAAVSAAIARSADRCIVVLDHSKLGADGHHRIIPCEAIDTLIVDSGLSDEARAQLGAQAFQLIVVSA